MEPFLPQRLMPIPDISPSTDGEFDGVVPSTAGPGVHIPIGQIGSTRKRKIIQATPRTRYGQTPPPILTAWQALIPAIIELSYHADPGSYTLIQAIRRVRNMNGTGANRVTETTFKEDKRILDGWLYDVLVPLGTLPFETNETSEKFSNAAAQRLLEFSARKFDGNISAHSRNEAMICLEILCSKAWYEREKEGRSSEQIYQSLHDALLFLYWECGIPNALTLLWDDPLELWHPAFEEARRYNFRQLYAVHEKGLLGALVDRIGMGVRALAERREFFASRFKYRLLRDVRLGISFSEHVELIKQRYALRTEDQFDGTESSLTDSEANDDA